MTTIMPVLFVGHGSPMNAIEENEFSLKWRELGKTLPRPKAILCISAHWEAYGSLLTANEEQETIHDFGGFPRELYEAKYPAKGDVVLNEEIRKKIKDIELDYDWGLDHGSWSVLIQMYPNADIPVVQLSLDEEKSAEEHYELGKKLIFLREKGVLILCSGNLIHNLRMVEFRKNFNEEFAFDWAKRTNDLFKKLILEGKHKELIDYEKLGREVMLAVPTPEHYLPMIYALGLKIKDDKITLFNDKIIAGSLSMTSFVLSDKSY